MEKNKDDGKKKLNHELWDIHLHIHMDICQMKRLITNEF